MTGKGVRTCFWGLTHLGTPVARRGVCLWPASRVALSSGTLGASGERRAAFKLSPTGWAQTPGLRWRGNPGLSKSSPSGNGRVGRGARGRSRSVIGRFHQPADARPAAERGDRRKSRGEFLGGVGGAAGSPNLEYGTFRRFPMRCEAGLIGEPGLPHGTTCGGTAGAKTGPRPAAERGERRCLEGGMVAKWGPNLEYGAFRRFSLRREAGKPRPPSTCDSHNRP